MQWHSLAASAAVSWLLTGCQPGQALPQADTGGPALSRLQKPDVNAPGGPAEPPEWSDKGGKGEVMARIQATVNGVPILEEEVLEASFPYLLTLEAKAMSPEERAKARAEIYNAQLQELINRELLIQDAESRFKKGNPKVLDKIKEAANKEFDQQLRSRKAALNLKTDEEFVKFLQEQGLSLKGMRRQYERNFLAKEYLRFMVGQVLDQVGHAQILEYFQKHPEEFQGVDSVDWQDIFIDVTKYASRAAARQFAEQIHQKLRKGDDFAGFVQHDDGDSKTRNGEGWGHRRGEIRPAEAEPILFRLGNGEVAPDLLELPSGFHVMRLVHRERAGPLPFDEKVQNRIRDKLRNEMGNREIQRVLADLKGKALIEVVNPK